MPQFKGSQAAGIPTYLKEGQPLFQSGLQLLDEAQPYQGEKSVSITVQT